MTATVLLLAATIFISIASAARKERAPLDGKATEYLLQGDILYRLGGLSLKGSPYAQMADVWRSAAVEDYEKAARIGSPAAIRRLVVLAGEEGRPIGPILLQMMSPKVAKVVGKRIAESYPDEVNLWMKVYWNVRIPPQEASRIAARVRELNLGPLRSVALATVYVKGGMPSKADAQQKQVARSALIAIFTLAVMLIGAALLSLVGALALVVYLAAPSRMAGTEPIVVPANRAYALWAAFALFLILLLLMADLPAVAVSALAGAAAERRGEIALALAGYAAAGVIALGIGSRLLRPDGLRAVGLRARSFGAEALFALAAYGAIIPVMAAAMLASAWLASKYGQSTEVHPIVYAIAQAGPWLKAAIFVTVAIVAPIVEETFFRGMLLTVLRRKLGVVGAVVVTSAVFALIHPQLPAGFLPLFVLACGLGAMTVIRGSLIPAIVAHSINNTAAFLIAWALLG